MELEQIDRYQLVEEIGKGGMAVVYRAVDPRFQRQVAVKVMTREMLDDATLIQRFQREAQTIAALEHPAIVPVYDFGEDQGHPYLVMRLMSGGTLSQRLKEGPLSIDETIRILRRIGSALQRAHEKGIVHRDLKPSNIMFDEYGDAYLADFGIARLSESAVTLTGDSVLGTPAYMSPEQIHGEKTIDGRSDIYALGVISFEMLTGRRPYEDKSPAKLMMKHILDPVPAIRQVKPDLPPEVDQLIARTMAKEPQERYASADEVAKTLESISRPTLAETRPDMPPPVDASEVVDVMGEAATVLEESQPAGAVAEEAYPQTEIATPSFVSAPLPETEVMQPTPPTKPREEKAGRSAARIAAIAAVVLVIAAGAVTAVLLLSNRDGQEEVAGEVPTEETEAQGETAAQVTSTPRPTRTPRPTATADPFPLAEAELERFYEFMSDGEYEQAREAINMAIEILPSNPWYYHELSWLDWSVGDQDAAFAAIERAIEVSPEDAEYYTRKAEYLREVGQYAEALEYHNQAILHNPSDAGAYFEMAITLKHSGEPEEALEAFDRAITLDNDHMIYYVERASTHLDLENTSAALADLDAALEVGSNEVWVYERLSDVFKWQLGDTERALEMINRAIELDPDANWRYVQRSFIYRDAGDYDSALADIEHAIDLDPNNGWFYYERAVLYVHYMDEPELALIAINLAIDIDPEAGDYYATRGSIQNRLGDAESALQDFNTAIELAPDVAWHYLDRGDLLYGMRQLDEAEADYLRCGELEEFEGQYWCDYHLGEIYREQGRNELAADYFQQFLDKIPEWDCPECQEEARRYIAANS